MMKTLFSRFFQRTAQYLPILYVNRLKVTRKHLKVRYGITTGVGFYFSSDFCVTIPQPLLSDQMPLEITYSPVSVGQLRLWLTFGESMKSMTALGQ